MMIVLLLLIIIKHAIKNEIPQFVYINSMNKKLNTHVDDNEYE